MARRGVPGRSLGLGSLLLGLGGTGRRVAYALDVLRAAGPRYAWDRRTQEAAMAARRPAPEDAVFGKIWGDAAAAARADVLPLGHGFYTFSRNGATSRAWRHIVPLDDAVSLRLALNKPLVSRLLSEEGIPVPEAIELDVRDVDAALNFLAAGAGPGVVKPAAASGGTAVTCGVSRRGELVRAMLRTPRHGRRVVVERQVPGEVHRLLLLDGELLGALRRRAPRLVGDGQSTVGQLIRAENCRRIEAEGRAGLTLLTIDLETVVTLARVGMGLDSVPAAGEMVVVKTVSNQNRVEDNETVHEPLDPSIVEQARAAVRRLGLRLAGVDIVAADLERSLAASGGAVIEVNGTPGLHYHYLVADADRATPVAEPILERMLTDGRRAGSSV